MEFKLKVAQLDLARQMETPEYIKHFIDLLAASGYNAILLYLEDRIKTVSYSYPAENECYSEAEIRELVEYAAKKGIESIPCVSTLGHMERFLRHEKLKHFGEVRPGVPPRFTGEKADAFCPSNPEANEFIFNYIVEVKELFPSQYFHAGLDEVWNFNLCPECRKKAPDLPSEQRLFLEHLLKVHAKLTSLGKRMMIWADMFEFYPDILADVPRDIIMIDWHYAPDIREYNAHFMDLMHGDILKHLNELGFDTIIAPGEQYLTNVSSFIEYAADKNPLGCIITSWEKTDTFTQRGEPFFFWAGKLMESGCDNRAFKEMMTMLFGTCEARFSAAVRQYLVNGFWRHFTAVSTSRLFSRNYTGLKYINWECDRFVESVLRESTEFVKNEYGMKILEDMIFSLRERLISYRLKKAIHSGFDKGFSLALNTEINTCVEEFHNFLNEAENQWAEKRPGITPNVFSEKKTDVLTGLTDAISKLKYDSFVRLTLCLPDQYGIENIRVFVRRNDKWQEIASDIYKSPDGDSALFDCFIPYCPNDFVPDAVKLDISGFGGIGVCYVQVKDHGRILCPDSVTEVKGNITNSLYITQNDSNFLWAGNMSIRQGYQDTKITQMVHSITTGLS